ncbi:enoyl-CoA hydratase [Alkalihalobacillus sp. CinArs1]|uniref:enoyl-CoA hydratase n=1 Tax=Alkalihalobacillus sp. CinArs1 TaxID=2995314 RepID=UPI0022DE0F20|nr:enoyl-CoA hydratase [Alkalihalobacillus sp. CinArs1]
MEFLKLSKENKVANISLERPPANAVATDVLKELTQILNDLENDSETKVILLTGEGRFFSAGADIKEFTTVDTEEGFGELGGIGQTLFDKMEAFPKPIIAAIHGAALGGGLELAMACHIRLATESAKLGLPELQLGLVPGFAGSQRLPELVGKAKAAEMLLTSEPITGQEAANLGLVNQVYSEDELLPKAKELAEKIAQKSAVTMRYALELLTYSKPAKFNEGVAKEKEYFGKAFVSEDGQEGIRAFIEKRKPNFTDK